MLEYLAYRKYKKNKSEKEARELARIEAGEEEDAQSIRQESRHVKRLEEGQEKKQPGTPQPLLDQDDEAFLESLLNDPRYDGPPPPLPARSGLATPEHEWDSEEASSRHRHHPQRTHTGGDSVASGPSASTTSAKTKTKTKEKEKSKSHNPISFLLHRNDKDKDKQLSKPHRDPVQVMDPDEAERERQDLSSVLDDLNLGATKNNKAFALSPDNNELVRKFTLVLKDLVNGVPTAVDDLKSLVEDRDGVLKRNYDKLPASMKKLVAQLPDKVTNNMGPDIMAAAAASQGMKVDETNSRGGKANMKNQAKSLFMPKSLNDLITKPSAIIGMLKAIVNFLKLRWPAFLGVNVVWSVAIFCRFKAPTSHPGLNPHANNLFSSAPPRPLVLPQAWSRGPP